MKMGTIPSPWRYDAAAHHALQSANMRRPAILHYAQRTAVFPTSQGGLRFPLGNPVSRYARTRLFFPRQGLRDGTHAVDEKLRGLTERPILQSNDRNFETRIGKIHR
jgi:hypothetical protein